jgi:hypothetical protein
MKWVACFALCACAHNEPPPPVPLHWTDDKGNAVRDPGRTTESIRWREAHRANADPRPPPPEPWETRLRCIDGTLTVACDPRTLANCCVNQGGVARDPWGNVIFE